MKENTFEIRKRENIRKVNNGNSFYDVFEKRSFKDNQAYKLVAGLTRVRFSKEK